MNEQNPKNIALKLSEWYCEQDGTEPWLRVKDKKYVSMVSLLDKNSLDLKKESDVFKLFTLALNWNSRKYGRFAGGLSLFKQLYNTGFIDKIYNGERKFSDWKKIVGKTNAADRIVRSYFYLREKWDEIYDDLMDLDNSEGENYIDKIYGMFREGYRKEKTTPLKLKIFFVLRELRSQGILNIDGKYCCIPDNNVCKMMQNIRLFDKERCSM